MKRSKLTKFLVASERIQYESQYWTGYDPKLIEDVAEESKKVETGERNPAWVRFAWPWSRPVAMSVKYKEMLAWENA